MSLTYKNFDPGTHLHRPATATVRGRLERDDKKFPGNPTESYRTRQPLRVVGELED